MIHSLQAGQHLGRYELLCPAGQGGMAVVWLARLVGTRGFQKPVAIKAMLPSFRDDPDAEKMFQSEAALASRIRHPNVVEVLDLGEEGGVLYLVMEWIHGEPLSAVLTAASRRGGMPLGLAVRVGSQVCAGLHAAHELTDEAGNPLGVVHRDVSPHNVLIGFNGVVKLVDFGIAKVTAEASHLTQFGQVKGKIAYMAPEQLRLEPLDRRTDVFAAGILLYLLTTGAHPFKGEDQQETVRALCSDEPVRPPSSVVPNFPERLERVILRALAKKPEDRYATARELGEDLARSMPPSRGATQEELQKYLSELLPERLAHHQELIRRALEVHAGAASSAVVLDDLVPKTAQSSSTLRAVAVTAAVPASPAAARAPETPVTPVPSRPSRRVSLRPSQNPRTFLAVVAGALGGAALIAAITSSRGPAPSSPVVTSAVAPPAEVASSPEPSDPSHAATTARTLDDPIRAPDGGAAVQRVPVPAAPRGAEHEKRAAPPPARAPARRVDRPKNTAAKEGAGLKDPYGL